MSQSELLPHLFRSEFQKIVAVLSRFLGSQHLQAAEDLTSETFLQAAETWPYKGLPENPTAWLYSVAKNKARNYITRHQLFSTKIAPELTRQANTVDEIAIDWSAESINDSQLQMLFVICHPSLTEVSQIALALRILCGFGIEEISTALLASKETITKRLYRAKETLREASIVIELPLEAQLEQRLDTVLRVIYLLFSEGYYSQSSDAIIRHDLCLEAMRLCHLLLEYKPTDLPRVRALMALMCFHSSRFAARTGGNGHCILYNDQDESQWDRALISKGAYYLHEASQGEVLSKYHLEASIGYWHTIKEDSSQKWEQVLSLFDKLLALEYSSIAALNRAYVVSKVSGNKQAIVETERLSLSGNCLYHLLLGKLYSTIDCTRARQEYEEALLLSRSIAEHGAITRLIEEL